MIVQETNRYADEMLPHTKTVWALGTCVCCVFFGIAVNDGQCKKADLEVLMVHRGTVTNNDYVT